MAEFYLMQSIGLDCVLNCKGQVILRGCLKESPEDFIVNEIDTEGNTVTLHSTNIIPPLPITITTDTNKITNEAAEGDEVTTPTQLDTPSSPIETPPLSSLISSDSFSRVERLAIMWEEHVSVGGPLSDERVNIGAYDDKHVRTSVHLTFRKEFPSLKSVTEKTEEGVSEIIVVPDPAYLPLVPLIGSEESKKILQFVNITTRSPKSVCYLPPDDSRAHRTEVHRVIDRLFGHLVETKSFVESRPPSRKKRKVVDEDSAFCPNVGGGLEDVGVAGGRAHGPQICVRFRKKAYRIGEKGGKQSQSGGQNWYLKFVLKKENMETSQAVHKLSELLSCHPSQLSVAGLKDKKAITTQLMTLKNVTADRLSSLTHPLLQCGNYEYVSHPLRLGELCGNHFQLRVTNLSSIGDTADELIETTVKERISALRADGFINYYGPQRFGMPKAAALNGTMSILPAQIGLAMLKEDSAKAVNLILQPDNNDWDGPINKAKRYYTSTGDINGTLSRLPDNRNREILVLKSLKRHGISEYGSHRALLSIPYQMRQLYVHSFASLIWNHLASFRINWYGNQPVEGDLVLTDKQNDSKKVRPLTLADIESGMYTVHDVVLPLPGTNVVSPENKVGQKLSELLSSAGISMASFAVSRKFGFAVPGAYRSVLSRPHNLSWEFTNRVPREMGVHVESTGRSSCLSASTNQCSYQDSMVPAASSLPLTDVAAPSASLNLCFDLDSSCYATSMLREILNQ